MMSIAKVFLILSLIISPFSAEGVISKKNLEEIKNNLFPNLETGVSETKYGDENYYVTLISSKYESDKNKSRRVRNKLDLLSKSLLLKHIRKTNKKADRIQIRGWLNGIEWTEDNRFYLLSYVDKENVKVVKGKNKPKKPTGKSEPKSKGNIKSNESKIIQITIEEADNEINNEIKDILNKLKEEGDDINLLYDLLSLYKEKFDIINVSKTQSKIMRACFKDKSIKFCRKK